MKISMLYNVVSLLLVLVSCDISAQDSWIKYKADDVLSFEIETPSEFVIKEKEIKTGIGLLTVKTYAYEATEEEPNYLYVINVIEYPNGSFPVDSTELIDEFLDEAVLSIAFGVEGEVIYSTDIPGYENGQGKLFRIKFDEEYSIIKGKTFLKDDVFITLQVYTTKENSLNDEMDDFLNSFKAKF